MLTGKIPYCKKMSKKKKNIPSKQASAVKTKGLPTKKTSIQTPGEKTSWLERPSMVSSDDKWLRNIFRLSFLAMSLITVLLALNSGINGDDEFQNDYSKKIISYYTTFGADKSATNIEKGKMHYYGGFFDLATGMINHVLGLTDYDPAYHHIRHLFNAALGLTAMLFAGLLGQAIGGWRVGLLALYLIFLSPRFLGHTLMNPKDIPFAAGFAIALYYLTLLLKQAPNFKWQNGVGIAVGFGLALASRAGGLLLVPYIGMALGLDFLFRFGINGVFNQASALGKYLFYIFGAAVLGYILAILTWPAALEDPLKLPFKALSEFSELGIKIRVLFMGENLMSDDTPWYYALSWIIRTIPLFALFGMLGGLAIIRRLFNHYTPIPVFMLFFASIFPVAYVIYKDSILHDGWRHLMFIYPSLIVTASLFWVTLEKVVAFNKNLVYGVYILLGILVLDPVLFILRNPSYPYVYFNPLNGGIKGAYGNYETDYWGVSVKQALNWLEKSGKISPEMKDTVVIGTSFYYNASRITGKKYNGKVVTKYVRFNNRYSENWDYGIFPSRYIRGAHLKSGNWPNSKTVFTVKANDVPLTAIEYQPEKNAYLGDKAIAGKDWASAVNYYKAEVEKYPDNELAWIGMANAYLNLNQNNESLAAAEKCLEVAPDNENALYFLGLGKLRAGDARGAEEAFLLVLKENESYYIANYYLALLYQQNNKLSEALAQALAAINSNSKFKAGYELAASIYSAMGDQQNAARYQQAAGRL